MRNVIKTILCLMMALLLVPCSFAEGDEAALAQQLTTLESQIADAEAALAQQQADLAALRRQHTETMAQLKAAQGAVVVKIDIANHGLIALELYPEHAPVTVANFLKLTEEGFYDGLTFHRIIAGFMMQGGAPNGTGSGGSAERIKGEFAQNGWNNPIAHERGVISMARSSAPDSASSQFFIMHEAAPHLDGAYAAFGRVISGMEVVDAICTTTRVSDYNGTVPNGYRPVIISISVVKAAE